ncbi:MAG: hydroxymethylbilane synthase [Nitriliruptorales bacterium]|nr:hydroxymethylbilane synthase [Nitriliruptorales bacterium]
MIRIATRRSALAKAQAFQTARLLQRRTGEPFELVPMATSGDLAADVPVDQVDIKGMFVDTIRAAVLDGECDLAVHSYKDLPSDPTPGLTIAAVPEREDPRDILISRNGYALATLPAMATVGTSSQRRRLQLLRAKPGAQVLPIRGNLDTRMRKVADGEYDAVVVAYAGLRRLYAPTEAMGLGPLGLPLKAAPLEPGECLPAAAQGALAVECRYDDERMLSLVRQIEHMPTRRTVTAERSMLEALGGGCLAAVGALCSVTGIGGLELLGMTGDPDRRRIVRLSWQMPYDKPVELGRQLAGELSAAMGSQ